MPPKTAFQDRVRLFAAHKRAARQMGIKDGTARAILRKAIIAGEVIDLPHGGPHNTKVTEDMRKAVEDIISENCTLSLKEINLKLQQRLPEAPKVSRSTFSKCQRFTPRIC